MVALNWTDLSVVTDVRAEAQETARRHHPAGRGNRQGSARSYGPAPTCGPVPRPSFIRSSRFIRSDPFIRFGTGIQSASAAWPGPSNRTSRRCERDSARALCRPGARRGSGHKLERGEAEGRGRRFPPAEDLLLAPGAAGHLHSCHRRRGRGGRRLVGSGCRGATVPGAPSTRVRGATGRHGLGDRTPVRGRRRPAAAGL